jgi:hypothetical protein
MDDDKYRNLVRNARLLYTLIGDMEKILLDMFIDEFMDLDEQEEKLRFKPELLPH